MAMIQQEWWSFRWGSTIFGAGGPSQRSRSYMLSIKHQDEKVRFLCPWMVTLLLLLLFLMLFFCFVKVAFPVKIFCLPTRRKKRKNLNLKSAPWWKLKKRVSQDPVLAVEAVQVVDENVDQDQAVYSHLISFVFMFHIFIGPGSDLSLPMSVTD